MLPLGFQTMICQKWAYVGRVVRRGWDVGKHRPTGIPPIPPDQIPQATKIIFARDPYWVVG